MDTKEQIEEVCRNMINSAVQAHNSQWPIEFKGAAYFTAEEINSALDNVSDMIDKNFEQSGPISCASRRELEIMNELHTITCMGTRGAILNYDQSEFVKRFVGFDVLWGGS
jgi:hypothetical protein